MKLAGKRTIVTGSAAGIGEAIAHKFAREGASVLVADLPGMPVADVVSAIREAGGKAEGFEGDLGDEQAAQQCVDAAIAAFGGLDILANNAAVLAEYSEVDVYDVASFDYTIWNNDRSAFLMTKFVLPHLKRTRGNIVYTGSVGGMSGTPGTAVYGGSKAFIHAFCKGVAQEQAKNGVRANCVCPGTIHTAWNEAGTGGPITPEIQKLVVGSTPLGRQGTPEEMANVAVFLASDDATFMTGSLVVADGGVTPAQGLPGDQVPEALRAEPKTDLPLRHSWHGFINKEVVNPVGSVPGATS